VVGVRGVRAGGDDREVDAVVAVVAQQGGEVGGHLHLAAGGEAQLDEVEEGGVGRGAGGGERRELAVVLDRAQQRQRGGHRGEARTGQRRLEAEDVQRPAAVRQCEAPGGVEQPRGDRVRVLAVGPGDHLDPEALGALELGREENRVTAGLHREQREPLGHERGRVAREVEEIRARGREHAGQPALPRRGEGALDPRGDGHAGSMTGRDRPP
jgi:hypothetical protein